MKRILPGIFALVFIVGCGAEYAIRRDYDFKKIKSVAVVDFSNTSVFGNSGNVIEDEFVYQLLKAGFKVIERSKVDLVLKEKGIASLSENDPELIKSIGRILGVDAIITGTVSKYIADGKNTIYTTDNSGNVTAQVFLTEAEVDVSARMIDVYTGEVVWSAKDSDKGFDIQNAVSGAASGIIDSLAQLIK